MTTLPWQLPVAGHGMLAHDRADQRRDALTAWIRDGIRNGEKVIHAQPAAGDGPLLFATIDARDGARPGQVELATMTQLYDAGGQRRMVETALADGWPGVRLVGPSQAALGAIPLADYVARERELDLLCRTLPVTALCLYDASALADEHLAEVVTPHTTVVESSMRMVVVEPAAGGPAVVEVAGVLDVTNAAMLRHALARAAADRGAAELVVDLCGVRLLSAAGARALVDGTGELRSAGGQVRLLVDSPIVTTVLTVLGTLRARGIRVDTGPVREVGTPGGRR